MTVTKYRFAPATKIGAKARIALIGGPSGGKTWTALRIAQALETPEGSRIGLVDSDRKSAAKYAHEFAFDVLPVDAFDPDELTRITIDAAEQRIDPLIIDTWSPWWDGAGGMLDQVGKASSNFEGWRQMRPVERRMFDALLGYPGHVIVTMRTKVEYVVEINSKGQHEPRRVGLAPIQRDGVEYEFDLAADVADFGRTFRVTKSRCPELVEYVGSRVGEEVGQRMQAWLDRDAVGSPLNPQEVRNWALEQPRTAEELRERYAKLEAAGQLGASVYARNGDLVAVGELLRQLVTYVERATRAAARSAGGAAGNGAGNGNGRAASNGAGAERAGESVTG